MTTTYPWESRFWSKVQKTDPCWLWMAGKRCGYGVFWDGERDAGAHRLSYVLHKGPIPEGLEIDHLCFVPECVNPAHLEAVTKEENLKRRGVTKTHCAQGHPWIPENIGFNRWQFCKICTRASKARYKARQKAASNGS